MAKTSWSIDWLGSYGVGQSLMVRGFAIGAILHGVSTRSIYFSEMRKPIARIVIEREEPWERSEGVRNIH